MKIRYIAAAAFLCSTAAWGQALVLSDELRAEGEAMVRTAGAQLADTLRDTSGTRFRNVFLRKTIGKDGNEHVSLCGEVNSRNGFGGMSGFHSFMLAGDRVWVGGPGQILNADEICNNGRGTIDGRDYTPELRAAFDANAGG